MTGRRHVWLAAVLMVAAAATLTAQIQYKSGQNVAPVFEGWIQNADGSFDLVFGYFNRNYEEVVDVPIGPENNMQPGGPDRGQPTHFYTRRNQALFKVPLPKGWDPQKPVIWTLTANGRTDKAKGWLQPEWEIENGLETNKGEANKAPVVTGAATHTITWPTASLTLEADATDDGVPQPTARERRQQAAQQAARAAATQPEPDPDNPRVRSGLAVRWVQHRGPGSVTFEPGAERPVVGEPVHAKTTATFSAPGTYVVWAIAKDGLTQTVLPITVTVNSQP